MSDPLPLGAHIRRTVALALPIMVARSAILIMVTVDAVMTGWASARELAYLGLGAAPVLPLMIMSIGALQATVVLVSQAVGAGEAGRVGAIWRIGLFHALMLGALIAALSLAAFDLFIATGQDPTVAREAAPVARAFAVGVPGMLLFIATNLTLEATGRPQVGMVIMIAANIVNVVLNGVFIFGWGGLAPPGGAFEAVATSSALRWAVFVAAAAYIVIAARRGGDEFAILAPARAWALQWLAAGGDTGRRLRRIGLPMALTQGVESGAFAAIVFVAGRLGAETLAAHQATMTVASLIYMLAIGMAGATSIRVGNAVGRGVLPDVARAGWVGIGLAAVFATPFAVLALTSPESLARVFIDEAAVVAIARETMWTLGWIFAIDAMMGATLGALRGTGDVWAPLALQAGAFWLVGVPAAWALAVPAGVGAAGLWLGIAIAITVSLALLFRRFGAVASRAIRRV